MNRYYVHNDHLGTPQSVTNDSGHEVWRADYRPFGEPTINADVDGDANLLVMNVRFPGQYYDAESGNHYNYFRDYNPSIGRYVQSDPIGLDGGMNTYLYALANPTRFIDFDGGMPCDSNDPDFSNCKQRRAGPDGPQNYPARSNRFGIFGCAGVGASFTEGDSNARVNMSPCLGGGIMICEREKSVCETDESTLDFSPSVTSRKFGAGIGISFNDDGSKCILIGLFEALGHISLDLGDL